MVALRGDLKWRFEFWVEHFLLLRSDYGCLWIWSYVGFILSFLRIMVVQRKWSFWENLAFTDYESLKMLFLGGRGELLCTVKPLLFYALWPYAEVAIRRGFVILQNTSILTDNVRLKKMMSLGCVTFHFYGSLENLAAFGSLLWWETTSIPSDYVRLMEVVSLKGFKFYRLWKFRHAVFSRGEREVGLYP